MRGYYTKGNGCLAQSIRLPVRVVVVFSVYATHRHFNLVVEKMLSSYLLFIHKQCVVLILLKEYSLDVF